MNSRLLSGLSSGVQSNKEASYCSSVHVLRLGGLLTDELLELDKGRLLVSFSGFLCWFSFFLLLVLVFSSIVVCRSNNFSASSWLGTCPLRLSASVGNVAILLCSLEFFC